MIKLFVIDVDGTMTDGGIFYDGNGNEMKKFCTRDAAAFFVAHKMGMEILVLTGRESVATKKRMTELKVDYLEQNVKNKYIYLNDFLKKHSIYKDEVCYIGDDLNDIQAMQLAGYIGCPYDSCNEIKRIANYISPIKGGDGAVRDIIEHILLENNYWNLGVNQIYSSQSKKKS